MANANDRGFNTIQNSKISQRRKTDTLQTYTLLGVIALAALTVVMLFVMAIGGIVRSVGNNDPTPTPDSEKVDWGTFTVTTSDTLEGVLVLVNNSHAYTFPSTEEHLENIYKVWDAHTSPRPYVLSGLSASMDRTALNAMDKMLTDFYGATGNSAVQLRYAYCGLEDTNPLDCQPGYSDFHTGLGCELKYIVEVGGNKPAYDLSLEPIYNWIFENCHKYGFIIRFPADKVEITGVDDHTAYFRYVGVAHATYMHENNLCMEEYVEKLKDYTEKKPLKINGADGKYYEVYYVAVDGSATVKHPTNYAYTISGTNEGGVVVTVDRSQALTPEPDTTAVTAADTGTN